MKKTIYVYLLDSSADWEIGYLLQGMSMQSMKKDSKYIVKTVGRTNQPIKSLGGLTITPDCTLEEIEHNETAALLLPGANIWTDDMQKPILEIAYSYIHNLAGDAKYYMRLLSTFS